MGSFRSWGRWRSERLQRAARFARTVVPGDGERLAQQRHREAVGEEDAPVRVARQLDGVSVPWLWALACRESEVPLSYDVHSSAATPPKIEAHYQTPLEEARDAHRKQNYDKSCSAALVSIAQSLAMLISPTYRHFDGPGPGDPAKRFSKSNPDIDRL